MTIFVLECLNKIQLKKIIKDNIFSNDKHEKVENESYRANTNMGNTISI
jgi:hypothetical protein